MYNEQLLKDDINTIRYTVLKILKITVKNKTIIIITIIIISLFHKAVHNLNFSLFCKIS